MSRVLAAAVALVAACGHARPTVTGAELYAQVHALQATGRATIGAMAVRKGQVLASGDQVFVVEQVIDRCRGGDPATDVDCTLALLLDQRFTVLDHAPQGHASHADGEDRSASMITSGVVVGVAVAAAGGLVLGAATCDFPGCKYVFGVPIVFLAGAALIYFGRD